MQDARWIPLQVQGTILMYQKNSKSVKSIDHETISLRNWTVKLIGNELPFNLFDV